MPDDSLPGEPGNPAIELIQVSCYGKSDDLKGQIWHAKPAEPTIVVCLYKGGWWNKPSSDKPATSIHSSGLWICNVTTESDDEGTTNFRIQPIHYPPKKQAAVL